MDMTSQGEFPWHCPPCLLSQLPFPDTSVLDSSVSSISSDDNVDHDLLLISDVLSTPPVRLRIVHHNVQGLLSKWTDLQGWLSDAAPSGEIFCFSDTWLKPGLPQPQFSGFQAYFAPHLRRSSSCSMQSFLPGSCLFVSSMLSPEHPSMCDDIEHSLVSLNVSCCFITCRQQRIAVACVYRSPSAGDLTGLEDFIQLLSMLSLSTRHIVLAGDINIDLFRESSINSKHCDILSDFGLVQLVNGPSRVTDVSATLIDHVLCSSDVSILRSVQAVGLSDHRIRIVELDIDIQRCHNVCRNVRSFRKYNCDGIRDCLANAPWSVMSIFDDVDEMWEFFSYIIQSCLDQFVPLKRIYCKYSKRHTPWLLSEIMLAIREKHKAKQEAECSGNPDDLTRYKCLKNKLKTVICTAKLSYLQELLQQSRKSSHLSAKLWSQVNDVIAWRKNYKSSIC